MLTTQPKGMTWAGWILTALLSALLLFSGSFKIFGASAMGAEKFKEQYELSGFPIDTAIPIGITEIACVVVYLFPRTAVLGAVLLTGYLGGATATHARLHEPFFMPVVIGMLVWLAVFLREPRLRAILPWMTDGKPNDIK